MIGLPYGEKNYDNTLCRFHTIPERNGRRDRRTDKQTDLLYHYRASVCWRAVKNNWTLTKLCRCELGRDTVFLSKAVVHSSTTRLPQNCSQWSGAYSWSNDVVGSLSPSTVDTSLVLFVELFVLRFCRAMLCISVAFASSGTVTVCPSILLTVTFVYYVKMSNHNFTTFSPSCSLLYKTVALFIRGRRMWVGRQKSWFLTKMWLWHPRLVQYQHFRP